MELKYQTLFSSMRIGHVTFKNRILSAPISLQELSPDCFLSQENIAFFELRAKGGAANVTIGGAVPSSSGSGHTKELRLDDPLIMPSLTHAARTIKRHNAIPSIEFYHAGKYAGIPNIENPHPKFKPYGPMREVTPDGIVIEQMDEDMMNRIADEFAMAAKKVKEAGFEMIMIHAGHGWLFSQFMTPANQRDDQYGGTLENRMRFPIMIVEAMRSAVGPGFPIHFRMNANELYKEGHGLDEAVKIAKLMENHVDLLDISAGNNCDPESYVTTIPSMFLPHAVFSQWAAEIKKNVKIPVSVVAGITEPELAEEILANGTADFVEMGRALIADPFLPKKAREGRDEDILKCMKCLSCISTIVSTRDTACALNPVIGEEELYFSPAGKPERLKKVLVAGGGPGGMMAALTAAKRGHEVILCEKSDKLGGQILCEQHVDFKKNYYGYSQWLIHQLSKQKNAEVRLNTKVTPELVAALAPEAIICAIGAEPIIPNIPGIDDKKVIFCKDLEKEDLHIGQKVVVIGAGLVGTESAIHFLRHEKDVTLVEAREDFAIDANMYHKIALGVELKKGIHLKVNSKVKEITKEGVVVINQEGSEEVYPADTVFCAVGFKSRLEEVEALRNSALEFTTVGDCIRPGKAQSAIHNGYYAAIDL